jgi:hypothetical protein
LHIKKSCWGWRRRRYLPPILGQRRKRPAAVMDKSGDEELADESLAGVITT